MLLLGDEAVVVPVLTDPSNPVVSFVATVLSTLIVLAPLVLKLWLSVRDLGRHQNTIRQATEREWADISLKVETMWRAWLARGAVEGEANGLIARDGKMAQSLSLTPIARTAFSGISESLRAIYASLVDGRAEVTDSELAMRIEQTHRDWIITNICLPFDVRDLACLDAAVRYTRELVAKDRDPVFVATTTKTTD